MRLRDRISSCLHWRYGLPRGQRHLARNDHPRVFRQSVGNLDVRAIVEAILEVACRLSVREGEEKTRVRRTSVAAANIVGVLPTPI
jgi:hypothetical protein